MARFSREEEKRSTRNPDGSVWSVARVLPGIGLFLLLAIVLFFPLFNYSTFSHAATTNPVIDAAVQLRFANSVTIMVSHVSVAHNALPTATESLKLGLYLSNTRRFIFECDVFVALEDLFVQVLIVQRVESGGDGKGSGWMSSNVSRALIRVHNIRLRQMECVRGVDMTLAASDQDRWVQVLYGPNPNLIHSKFQSRSQYQSQSQPNFIPNYKPNFNAIDRHWH